MQRAQLKVLVYLQSFALFAFTMYQQIVKTSICVNFNFKYLLLQSTKKYIKGNVFFRYPSTEPRNGGKVIKANFPSGLVTFMLTIKIGHANSLLHKS